MKKIKAVSLCLLLVLILLSFNISAQDVPKSYEELKQEAENYYNEKSYSLSHETYKKAKKLKLSEEDKKWVEYRLADTKWRSSSSRWTKSTNLEETEGVLRSLITDIKRDQDKDLIWAEINESLGDFWWVRRYSKNWDKAWPYYEKSLDWWAGSENIDQARERYIGLVWKISEIEREKDSYYRYLGYYRSRLPIEVIENVLKIAQTDEDKSHAHYLLATVLSQQQDFELLQRVPDEFDAALQVGSSTEWYEAALFSYADWLQNYGRVSLEKDGSWKQKRDYVGALELYQRFVTEFIDGESYYYDRAQKAIRNITEPKISVKVSNIFLPDSEIQFHYDWRNIDTINFSLYKVDLTKDIQFKPVGHQKWLNQIDLLNTKVIKSWTKNTGDKKDYIPGKDNFRFNNKLETGAYVIEAKSGQLSSRELILVSDATLVLKILGNKAIVYFCNAIDGSPIPDAEVALWEGYYEFNTYYYKKLVSATNKDGIAEFKIGESGKHNLNLTAFASRDSLQAFSNGYGYYYGNKKDSWKIYAFTDRPAYRPEEEVQWKFIARKYDGSVYSTPENQIIKYYITDPKGSNVKEDEITLNSFGSAWGKLKLSKDMPLGRYTVQFLEPDTHESIGQSTLFRLEEYKLPEFKISIKTPEHDGRKKTFRLGEKVEAIIQADYYFGAPVANADVEVVLYEKNFQHRGNPKKEYDWLYSYQSGRYGNYRGGNGKEIKREKLKTDDAGKAKFIFDTPKNSDKDFEYTIEARITDSSRREVIGTGTVKVTKQSYYTYTHAEHSLYSPNDKVEINIKTLDANDQPVGKEGEIKVAREVWNEIWIDPDGNEISDDKLDAARKQHRHFPPIIKEGKRWQLKFKGYEQEDILTQKIKTNQKGEGQFSFRPKEKGYYTVKWVSIDRGRIPIKAQTTIWVTTNKTTDLGYRHGGVEVIVDKDTFRVGNKARVMINVPTNDRYVLFGVETGQLLEHRLIHVEGTVKMLEIDIEEKHAPNIFLSAAMVNELQLSSDSKEVLVPPAKNFLKVKINPNKEQYSPREQGTLTVTTLNHNNKPISAEVSLGLIDQSALYIQDSYASDPRKYYFGTKRRKSTRTSSTFQHKPFINLIETEDKKLIDSKTIDHRPGETGRELNRLGSTADVTFAILGASARDGLGYDRTEGLDNLKSVPASRKLEEARFRSLEKRAMMHYEMAPASIASLNSSVIVRSDFRSTAFWKPDIVTDKNGRATVKVKFPDSLTTWEATARVASEDNQFGIATSEMISKKPLIVRLQAPRFFVVGDKVTVSAVINNNSDKTLTVTPRMVADGLENKGLLHNDKLIKSISVPFKIKPNGDQRVDWILAAKKSGTAKLKVSVAGSRYSDAMERTYEIYEHGIDKLISKSGKFRGQEAVINLDIPKERKKGSSELTVQITPSLAVTMLDALPYLIDYPYGCTEQTMSRFLPAVITAKTLRKLGLEPDEISNKVFGGIEQQYTDKTQPKGKKNIAKFNNMVKKGLERLYDFQHSDGGWGWWKHGESDNYMTAYVVWGLSLASNVGINFNDSSLRDGVRFLRKELVDEKFNYNNQVWMLHALSEYYGDIGKSNNYPVGRYEQNAFDNLWEHRDRLNPYSKALLAISAHNYGLTEKAKILLRNLEDGVVRDTSPDTSVVMDLPQQSHDSVMGTAHWGEDRIWRRWYDGAIETTAFTLKALVNIDPDNRLIEPTMNWLIKNRRGAQWSNTKDTAITILALNDYLVNSGELDTEIEYELSINGKVFDKKKISKNDILKAPSSFNISNKLIRDGINKIKIEKLSGDGPVYFSSNFSFFSLEEPIKAAGNEIFLKRQYFKLVPKPTLLKGYVYEKVPLLEGDTVKSGDRIETVLTIESKNDYEYLVFEDLKPAGFEAVQIKSGQSMYVKELKPKSVNKAHAVNETKEDVEASKNKYQLEKSDYTGRARWVHQELRDRKIAIFVDKLKQGIWEIRYDLRAETPGEFHALPLMGHAMYVPEIKANGKEIRVKVLDQKD